MPRLDASHVSATAELVALRCVCDGCDPARPREEEVRGGPALWLVTAGAFELRDRDGRHAMDAMRALVVDGGHAFTIRHPSGPDTCISFRGPLVTAIAASWRDARRAGAGWISAELHARVVAELRALRDGDGDPLALAEALAELGDTPPAAPARGDRDLAAELAHVVRLTHTEDATLDELSRAAGTSTFHACRVFRAATGHTLHGFRRELRLRHALSLLVDSDVPLADIAAGVGFASQSHLTNRFRARFGATPGVVRARRRLSAG